MGSSGKSRDKEFKKSVKVINGYLKKLDSRISPLSEGTRGDMLIASTVLSYANISTGIAVVKPEGHARSDLIFMAPLCPLPKENLLPFYRQLLVWNYFKTGVAHFAINDESGVICMVLRRPVLDLDYPEFKHNVENISSITLNAIFMLKQQFGV